MIKSAIGTVIVLAIGGFLVYYGMGHHVVKTDQGYITMPKEEMSISNTFADIREWEREDFEEHPEITTALLKNGYEDLVPVTSSERIKDWIKDKARDWLE